MFFERFSFRKSCSEALLEQSYLWKNFSECSHAGTQGLLVSWTKGVGILAELATELDISHLVVLVLQAPGM